MKNALLRAFVLVLTIAGVGSTIGAKTMKSRTSGVGVSTTHNLIPTCVPSTCGVD